MPELVDWASELNQVAKLSLVHVLLRKHFPRFKTLIQETVLESTQLRTLGMVMFCLLQVHGIADFFA